MGERHRLVDLRGHLQQARALDQVDLVEDQHLRPLEIRKLCQDRLGFLVDALARVEQQRNHVRIARSAPGRGHHGPVEAALRLEDAGRVHEHDLRLALDGDAAHQRPRRLHLARDDRDLGADERVQQGRLARIRRADQGDETGLRAGLLRLLHGLPPSRRPLSGEGSAPPPVPRCASTCPSRTRSPHP